MTVLDGRYELLGPIAEGGMAEVLLARGRGAAGSGKRVVVKRVLPHLAREPELRMLFADEARLTLLIDHPNVVQVFECIADGDTLALVMEYVDGVSLRAFIKGLIENAQQPDPRLCARLVSQACEGLAAAHELRHPDTLERLQVIHRDVSPDNILVSRRGAVKVMDFGIARATHRLTATSPGIVRGKFGYMSPEQLRDGPLDLRTDLWSLGVTLFELVALRRPFGGETDAAAITAVLTATASPDLTQARPNCPKELARIVSRCLAPAPADRYPDCHALAHDLEQFISQSGPPISPTDLAQAIERLPTPLPTPMLTASRSIPVAASAPDPALELLTLADAGSSPPAPPLDASRPAAPAAPAALELAVRPARPRNPTAAEPEEPALERSAPRARWPVAVGVAVVLAGGGLFIGWQRGVFTNAAGHLAMPSLGTPEPGRLLIDSTPPGTVYLDGLEVGGTPWGGDNSSPAAVSVEVRRPGFTTWKTQLAPNEGVVVQVQLKKR